MAIELFLNKQIKTKETINVYRKLVISICDKIKIK